MLKHEDIDVDMVQESIEALETMVKNDNYSNRLLVTGMGKGSVADAYMSNDDEIIEIKKRIHKLILADK